MDTSSLYTIVLIFLWTISALFIIAVFLLTFFYGRFTVKDNPNKALIYIKTGRHIGRPIKGVLKGKPSNKGCKYSC